jgi:GMP reductase
MKLVRVKEVITEDYIGNTHDIEVGGGSGSHSYVIKNTDNAVNGLVVHNSVCTTRLKAGVGYPQLSAIMECADAAHGLGAHIIADGGCTCPGDVAKAFGAEADFVMLGGMLAGHDEGGGEIITTRYKTNQINTSEYDSKGVLNIYDYKVEENKFIQFYGMSSDTAMTKHHGGVADYRSSEGRTVTIPYKGSVKNTVLDLLGGLRSTCTYVGASSLKHLSKCTTFIRVNRQINDVYVK